MFVRMALPEEMDQFRRIQAIAFEWPYPLEEEPLPRENVVCWVGGEDRELYGGMEQVRYAVRFDGHAVNMGGIGGVATLPQHRRRGVIRACIQAVLENMFSEGDVFASLYPFSRAYYRKFGFADGSLMNRWTIPFSALKVPEAGGRVEMVLPDGDLTVVQKVCDEAFRNWNLSAFKTDYFIDLQERNWMKDCRYLYVWRDENDVPAGLILFSKDGKVMNCAPSMEPANALLFRDARALFGLLNFTRGFSADYSEIRFAAAQNVNMESLVGEDKQLRCERLYSNMVRAVNVRKALELCRCRGTGSLKISVKDEILRENEGTWQLDFSPEGNAVRKVSEAPDVQMSSGTLAQLLLGIRGAEDLPMMPEVRVLSENAPLASVFYPKTCVLTEWF